METMFSVSPTPGCSRLPNTPHSPCQDCIPQRASQASVKDPFGFRGACPERVGEPARPARAPLTREPANDPDELGRAEPAAGSPAAEISLDSCTRAGAAPAMRRASPACSLVADGRN